MLGGDVFGGDLAGTAIWKNLPFVKSGSVHRLPDGIWIFGGPKSTEQFIDAAVQAVTS
jgi:ferric hydroxamate transport system substrate-binding protein